MNSEKPSHNQQKQLAREAFFHDRIAKNLSEEEILPVEAFESPASMENQFILRKERPLNGKKVLDLGGGYGEAAIYFAIKGAESYICDVSSSMIEMALSAARKYNVEITGTVCPAEKLEYPDDFFDFIYLNGVLHHVSSRPKTYEEMWRVLKPEGKFYAIEPLAGNPVINIYRRMANKMRSEDETPLTLSELSAIAEYFPTVKHQEFWLFSLALFLKYFLINRVHPNDERYWKKIYKETNSTLWWWQPFRQIDRVLTRIPLLRSWCWNTVIWAQKSAARI